MGIERISEFWPDWTVGTLIGEGSYGKVYKAVRSDRFLTTEAAIKVIGIPRSNAEFEALRSEGMTEDESKSYLEGVVFDFVNEIKLMEALKNTPNVVSVEDYKIVEKKDGVGWDIYIRMELLQSFRDYSEKNTLTKKDVIKLGLDIASALELCEKNNIIHRDIKPANIFISRNGDYKLGDFGVAKELSKTSGAMSSKGTYTYMAPEVAHGMKYDSTVDIYSLGIVMYTLLNNNRLPFTDPHSPQVSYNERLSANERRLSGEDLPAPCNADAMLADVVLSACNYDPKLRFRTATAFKNALKACLSAGSNAAPAKPITPPAPKKQTPSNDPGTVAVRKPPKSAVQQPKSAKPVLKFDAPSPRDKKPAGEKKKISKRKLVGLVILLLLLVFAVWAAFNMDTVIDFVEEQIEYINNMPTEKKYKNAQELMDGAEYSEAADILRGIYDYKDSDDLLEDCLEEIQKDNAEEQNDILKSSSFDEGSIVKFGFYEQDNDTTNGREEIEWIVLENDDGYVTMISQRVLDVKKYDENDWSNGWEYSTLQRFLNKSFTKTSFTSEQKDFMISSRQSLVRVLTNDEFEDYQYLFSTTCYPTDYATFNGCYIPDKSKGSCLWWLMDTRSTEKGAVAYTVDENGNIEDNGRYCKEPSIGVRPVITIDTDRIK